MARAWELTYVEKVHGSHTALCYGLQYHCLQLPSCNKCCACFEHVMAHNVLQLMISHSMSGACYEVVDTGREQGEAETS